MVRQQPTGPAQHLGCAVNAAFGRQHLQGAGPQFVGEAAAGLSAWLPDFPGLCCILVTLACLAYAPRAWSGRAASGGWSLPLVLLAAVAGAFRIASLGDYAYGYVYAPHLIGVGLAELLILAAAVALVAPNAARAQTAVPAPSPYPHPGVQPR